MYFKKSVLKYIFFYCQEIDNYLQKTKSKIRNFSAKPAYTAYATLTSELYGAKYTSALSGPGLEGYVFTKASGPQKTVVWAVNQASANITFHQSCVRRVDYLGAVAAIGDGDPTWDKDATVGQITLQVLRDQPIYVSGC